MQQWQQGQHQHKSQLQQQQQQLSRGNVGCIVIKTVRDSMTPSPSPTRARTSSTTATSIRIRTETIHNLQQFEAHFCAQICKLRVDAKADQSHICWLHSEKQRNYLFQREL